MILKEGFPQRLTTEILAERATAKQVESLSVARGFLPFDFNEGAKGAKNVALEYPCAQCNSLDDSESKQSE